MNVLATTAVHAAARVRARLAIGATDTVCPFDIAASLSVNVWFVNGPTLEGIFTPDPNPTIVVSSLRPQGRQRFTCAHEIGHFVFEHGERVDEQSPARRSPEEFVADRFASALLMPKLCVLDAFKRWRIDVRSVSPMDLFCVAQDLGVGYATLVEYLYRTLKIVDDHQKRELLRWKPKEIREEILGSSSPNDIFVVDHRWGTRPVDVQQQDRLRIPATATCTGGILEREEATMIRASSAGTATIEITGGRNIVVRIRKREYAGLSRYRHMEDEDE